MKAPRYSEQTEQQVKDAARINEAILALDAIEKQYHDVVAVDRITLTAVGEVDMPTRHGPVKAKDLYTRDELLAALDVLRNSPGASVPEAIYLAVLEYRRQNGSETSNNQE